MTSVCPGQWQAISLGLGAWGGRADGAPDILIYTLLAKFAWCVFAKRACCAFFACVYATHSTEVRYANSHYVNC